jgi:hypothetical protein
MPVKSPPPDDHWLEDQFEACRRTWPEHHDFRIEQSGDGPIFVHGYKTLPGGLRTSDVLVMIDHPESWSLLASMLWGS